MEKIMLARRNEHNVSVNESALCLDCSKKDFDAVRSSYEHWKDAEDVDPYDGESGLYPIDNPDGLCNGCGAETLWLEGHEYNVEVERYGPYSVRCGCGEKFRFMVGYFKHLIREAEGGE